MWSEISSKSTIRYERLWILFAKEFCSKDISDRKGRNSKQYRREHGKRTRELAQRVLL